MDKTRYHKPFMLLVVGTGLLTCVLSVVHLPTQTIDFRFLILAIATLCLGSRIGIEFSKQRIQLTVSDTFIFVTLLLYGGELAVLLAASEAFCSSFRFSKLWKTRLFNAGLLATSTYISAALIEVCFGRADTLSRAELSGTFVSAICLMALTQFATNSGIAALRESLKFDRSFWPVWKGSFLWTSVTYFAGASAAAITSKLIM